MSKVKDFADGFTSDAQAILQDFVDCKSLNFETFSDLWKKHNFGLVFIGRPSIKELREFVYDIYELTLNQIDNPVLEFQVGVIYLLYSLFINQSLVFPIHIRITPRQYEILLKVLDTAEKKKIGTLYYIIDYLLENCLEYVAFPSMFGPCTKKTRKDYFIRPNIQGEKLFSDIDQNLSTFHESKMLDEIQCMYVQYEDFNSKIKSHEGIKSCQDLIDQCSDFKNQLECLLDLNIPNVPETSISTEIGNKRVQLKTSQFERKINGRFGNLISDCDEELCPDEPSPSKSKKLANLEVCRPLEESKLDRSKKTADITPPKSLICNNDIKFSIVPKVVAPLKRRGPIGRASYLKPYNSEVKIVMEKVVSNLTESSDEAE